jgi:hypothetical protein
VRFADPSIPSSIPPSTPATSTAVDCRLGFLLVGGLYASDLFTIDAPSSTHDDQRSEPQPEARGLTASNLSVGVEPGARSGQRRVVLRLWADREGPFEARFALGLPPDQEVRCKAKARVTACRLGLQPRLHRSAN